MFGGCVCCGPNLRSSISASIDRSRSVGPFTSQPPTHNHLDTPSIHHPPPTHPPPRKASHSPRWSWLTLTMAPRKLRREKNCGGACVRVCRWLSCWWVVSDAGCLVGVDWCAVSGVGGLVGGCWWVVLVRWWLGACWCAVSGVVRCWWVWYAVSGVWGFLGWQPYTPTPTQPPTI